MSDHNNYSDRAGCRSHILIPLFSARATDYPDLLGSDVEVLNPFPGIVEFKVAPGVWLQIFETDQRTTYYEC